MTEMNGGRIDVINESIFLVFWIKKKKSDLRLYGLLFPHLELLVDS